MLCKLFFNLLFAFPINNFLYKKALFLKRSMGVRYFDYSSKCNLVGL